MRVPTFKALRRVLPAAICAALLLCGCGAAKPEAAPAAEKQEAAVPSATPAPTPAPTPEPTPAPTPEPEPEAGTPVEDPALRDWLDYLDGGWVSADQPEPYDWAGWLRGRIEAFFRKYASADFDAAREGVTGSGQMSRPGAAASVVDNYGPVPLTRKEQDT